MVCYTYHRKFCIWCQPWGSIYINGQTILWKCRRRNFLYVMHIEINGRWKGKREWLTAGRLTGCRHPYPKLLASKVFTPSVVLRTGGCKRKLPSGGPTKGIPVTSILECYDKLWIRVNNIPPKNSSFNFVISLPMNVVFPILTWGVAWAWTAATSPSR